MFKVIFYNIRSTDILDPSKTVTDWMISIEDEKRFKGEDSIIKAAMDCPSVVSIQVPPSGSPQDLYLEAKTLKEAHYLCMKFGYKVKGSPNTSMLAEYEGLHICGSLEKEYELKANPKKDVKSA